MYAAPPSITAEVFAVVPETIGYGNRRSDWADAQINGAATPTRSRLRRESPSQKLAVGIGRLRKA